MFEFDFREKNIGFICTGGKYNFMGIWIKSINQGME